MAPRIKIDSKFTYVGTDFLKHVRRVDLLLQGLIMQVEMSHMSKKIRYKVSKFTINGTHCRTACHSNWMWFHFFLQVNTILMPCFIFPVNRSHVSAELALLFSNEIVCHYSYLVHYMPVGQHFAVVNISLPLVMCLHQSN